MIKYVNHVGSEINLDDGEIIIPQADDLRDFAWEYSQINRPQGYGGRVDTFLRPIREKHLSIGIRADFKPDFYKILNAFHAITEADIQANAPGRLYVGTQYITCYLAVSSKITKLVRRQHTNFAIKELSVLVTEPFWTSEHPHNFMAGSVKPIVGGKRYLGRYPYRYGSSFALRTIQNSHFAACPCIITFHGPCVEPAISIGDHTYGVHSTAGEGERIVINQVDLTIQKITVGGLSINLFDYRIKESDQFAPIPMGASNVTFNGSFPFSVTLLYRRSEPEWTE